VQAKTTANPDSRPEPLRIVSWNIRAGGGKRAEGILAQLLDWRADVIGLCEYRATSASQWLAAELDNAGYHHQLHSTNPDKPATNALMLASRAPLQAVRAPKMPKHRERWLLAQIQKPAPITFGLMHVPNYTAPKLKYPFLSALLKMTETWKSGPAVLIGDTNCGQRGLDEENPQGPRFKREHDWVVGMRQRGWVDAFRHLHGARREYTWYSHRNNGFRLDHAFCSPQLAGAISGVQHVWGRDSEQPGRRDALSDHAALLVDLTPPEIRSTGHATGTQNRI